MPKILTESDRQQKRKAILDAAAAEIARFGYDRANINTIAERAGIGRGTIYLTFASKEDVLAALLETIGATIEGVVADALAGDYAWEERVRSLAYGFAGLAREHSDYLRVHVSALHGVNRDIGAPVARWLRVSVDHLAQAITTATARGEIRVMDPESLALSLLGMLESLVLLPDVLGLAPDGDLPRADLLAELLWRGMRPTDTGSSQ